MTLGKLALHVADIPAWITGTLEADSMDVTNAPRPPEKLGSKKELLDRFDVNVARLRTVVAAFDMAHWSDTWSMKNGDQVVVARPRPVVYRVWCLNHMIHHRGQLCLYLRLLNVPVPTVYFNTADEPEWTFE